ncbi:MAG TPA: Flp pilus assembly protein CpaB [Egibacteraceae bacterium]|nr:Flp pilus assembly protein CpaB [Egibacteraceae bacterium]
MSDNVQVAAPIAAPASAAPGAALRRPWWSRLSRAHVAALAAAVVAGGLNLMALQRGDARVPMLVAAADLGHGAALDPAMVRAVPMLGGPGALDGLVPMSRLRDRQGWLLTRRVHAGEPLRWSDLRDPRELGGMRAMSLPIQPEHAAGGALRPGDRVDVIAVREGRAMWVAAGVEVLDVEDLAAEGLGNVRAYSVTVAVTEAAALRLAWALHDGALELIRATGAPLLSEPGTVVADEAAA